MKRVLYVFCAQEFSGAEITFERMMLLNRSHVSAAAICPPGALAERLREDGIEVTTAEELTPVYVSGRPGNALARLIGLPVKLLRSTAVIQKAVRQQDVDVVHVLNVAAGLYSLLACVVSKLLRAGGRPKWIWTTKDMTYPARRDWKIARACCRVFDAVTTCSLAAVKAHPRDCQQMQFIHNGVDAEEFRPRAEARTAIREQYGIGAKTIVLGILGIVSEFKGHQLVLESLKRILSDGRFNVHLLIVGSIWPQHEQFVSGLRAFGARHGMSQNVTWIGKIRNIAPIYSGLDILINSTLLAHGEPFGNTICEAMSCERVVLAPRVGGPTEIISDGIDGFLCTPDSADALTERLQYILTHWTDMRRIEQTARQTVLNRFTIETMVANYNRLYADVLGRVW